MEVIIGIDPSTLTESDPFTPPKKQKQDIFPPSPPETAKESRRSSLSETTTKHVENSTADITTTTTRPYPLPPPLAKNQVLPQDLKTPDSHVERDPRLIRLTGIHPFNTEPPLTDLFAEGFLTSADLHYVRNHGAVPKVHDDDIMDWEFSVEGMVEKPMRLTLRGLIDDYDQVTYPITLVCAGNRRKEQNVVRKTKGFSWGAAGVSTALWTGVPLADLIARAVPLRGARYVCFEGADKLPNGHYGTSIKLNWAMDPNRGVLVAHRMNGDILHPDHGRPLRIVIPGQIGGRSVKWLRRVIVSSAPSDNWYHIYDNRVLPTMVSPEASADLPDTWRDERYAIYDLNTNSATCCPAHDETVELGEEGDGAAGVYTLKGYAYSGGGRRVTRVEITLDRSRSWTLAEIRYPEDEYRNAADGDVLYGGRVDLGWREACFCWCFWEVDVPIADLAVADDVMVRAVDDSMMAQPRDMYWSVLGMMNNPWYRVVIHRDRDGLRFEHPTQPALIPGGWMERVKKAGGNLANGFWGEKMGGKEDDDAVQEAPTEVKETVMVDASVTRTISLEELKQHEQGDQWFVVNGNVYDGGRFLREHPGGETSIAGAAGQDVSEEFLAIHSENAKAMLPAYHVGALDAAAVAHLSDPDAAAEEEEEASAELRETFLKPRGWKKALLRAKQRISPDTAVFTFALEHNAQTLGLPVGQHVMARLRDPATRDAIMRAYTPISEQSEAGVVRLLVKIYSEGRMSRALDQLPIGHWVDFKGPVGRFVYSGKGMCVVGGRERRARRFVMICAGSGITPIYQVFRAVMSDGEDDTRCLVLDGNRTEGDILLREELDELAERDKERCRVVYALTRASEGWTGVKRRMDKAFLEKEVGVCDKSGEDVVLICGPEALEKSVKSILTGDLGWREEDLVFF